MSSVSVGTISNRNNRNSEKDPESSGVQGGMGTFHLSYLNKLLVGNLQYLL